MTKTLESAALQIYAGVVSLFLPIPAANQAGLIADLEGNPFVGHALSSATCELYHRYGMFLAPLTAALTTIKYCQFVNRRPAVINDGNPADGGEPADSSGGTARKNSFARGAGTCSKGNGEESEGSKKLTAGRAGAAARQKQLLEQLQTAKESLRPPVSAADNDGTSASQKEAKPPKRTDKRQEPNWIPWIIGACLARCSLVCVFAGENMRSRANSASMAACPAPKTRINLPN